MCSHNCIVLQKTLEFEQACLSPLLTRSDHQNSWALLTSISTLTYLAVDFFFISPPFLSFFLWGKTDLYVVSQIKKNPPNVFTFIFSSVQSHGHVRLFATLWIVARQASLSITNSQSSLKLMSIESVMPSSHLILCRPLFLLPQIPPSIRVFSNESTLRMRWPKYWSFSFSVISSKETPGLISFRMDCLYFLAVQGTLRVFSNTRVQKHQFFNAQLSLCSNSHIHT